MTRAQRRSYVSGKLKLLIFLLLLLIGGLGFIAYANYQSTVAAVVEAKTAVDKDVAIELDGKTLGDVIHVKLADSLARPLLMSTRRPYQPPTVPETVEIKAEIPQSAEEITEQLVSIIITEGYKVAFLQGSEGTFRLEEGMSYKDWEVKEISSDSLTLTFNNQQKVLQLRTFATAEPIAPMRELGQSEEK